MKHATKKQKMTKLLLTATMCAVLLFGASACNNGADVNTNGDGNANVNANESTNNMGGGGTDENAVPTEQADPDAGVAE
ncbi:hypothetical protein RB620_06520 [Paenibacillus sp. LHD-117]|uniref:hypothetical protein n=1 Tax=Paenibacillus sp. LHD-117 TaxID=3071412 RepID=UPI0027DF50A5|nr:hypothetical protein [Paenibacillus sp. LHD-117]MDQ6419090.1 hypothetical protein [Paenibacillus sp. LHD-117]